VENCKKQIALGGWIQDYKEATEPMEESSQWTLFCRSALFMHRSFYEYGEIFIFQQQAFQFTEFGHTL
jgi:hypothetical protein